MLPYFTEGESELLGIMKKHFLLSFLKLQPVSLTACLCVLQLQKRRKKND